MPVETFHSCLEPSDPQAEIWRFVDLAKFRDFVTTGELFFCRADLFKDEFEGLPHEGSIPIIDPSFPFSRASAIGSYAQFREGFYVNCWHLFTEETARMWRDYGEDGVALRSRYDLFKAALNGFSDRAYLSLVRYGPRPLQRDNILDFIMTKRMDYSHEREVRAVLWIPDPHAGINRHFDVDNIAHERPLTPPPDYVPRFQRRKVNLQPLITRFDVSPYASDATVEEVAEMVTASGYSIPVQPSKLARYKSFLP